MAVSPQVAIIVPSSETAGARVKYHTIDSNTSSESVTALEALPYGYFVSTGEGQDVEQKDADPVSRFCIKQLQTSKIVSNDATTFLSNTSSRFRLRERKAKSRPAASEAPSVVTNNAAFVLGRPNDGDATFKPRQYHAITFALPDTSERVDNAEIAQTGSYNELLMIRQPGLQRSGAMSISQDLQSFDAFDIIEICTGMCLFTDQDLELCTQDRSIQSTRLNQVSISLCEQEIMLRLTTTIANTAALHYHGNETRRQRTVRINIDIPSIQYYKDALEALTRGDCSPKAVLEWITAIKHRRNRLFKAFASAIQHGLRKKGVPEGATEIVLSTGVQAAAESIFCALHFFQAHQDWLGLILSSLQHDPSEHWSDFLLLVDPSDRKPSSWRQLQTLTYLYEIVKPALLARKSALLTQQQQAKPATRSAPPSPDCTTQYQSGFFDYTLNSAGPPSPRVLLLAIDDVDEYRLYTKAYQSLCRLSAQSARSPGESVTPSVPITTRILALSPCPRVIFGAVGEESATWERMSLWRAPLRHAHGKALDFVADDGVRHSCTDVLRKVFDAELVDLVRKIVDA